MTICDGIKVRSELLFVEIQQMHYLFVFVHAGLHFSVVLGSFVELEQHSCEGLHDPG